MSAKWTPGPWLIDPNNEAYIVGSEVDLNIHGDPAYPEVCELANSYHEQANARLIAAAPDLAEALRPFADEAQFWDADNRDGQFVADDYEITEGLTVGHLRAARAALAKAGAT